jgi:tetratricopeptide (TPR) repeat protein
VNQLLAGLVGALLATNQSVAVSNLVRQTTGVSVAVTDPKDPVEQEYLKILEDDDAAQADADKWIKDNQAFKAKGAGLSEAMLLLKIEQRFEALRKRYEDFLMRHPKHTRARLAYGSFLSDTGKETEARDQWEKARELDPENPAAWNNLANYYGHRGPVPNSFVYYEKAIQLNPKEPVYYQNFATTVFLFRTDAMDFYHLAEQQVFDKALDLYRQALKLDTNNFVLATDLAQTYYGIKPDRRKEALEAWRYALKVAGDEIEREGVYVHLARWEMNGGQLAEAITNSLYAEIKGRLTRNLAAKQASASGEGTNAAKNPPAFGPKATETQ